MAVSNVAPIANLQAALVEKGFHFRLQNNGNLQQTFNRAIYDDELDILVAIKAEFGYRLSVHRSGADVSVRLR